MMNLVYRIFILVCATSLWFTLQSYQSGAAANGRSATGAPFGNGTCGSCHSGGSYGTVAVSIQIFEVGTTVPLSKYVGGKTYTAKLSITATRASPYYAFQMVAVNAANAQAGAWSGFPTGVRSSTLSSRTYVEQSTRLAANTYTMTWVAPAAGTGMVNFYACGNCINGTGGESGDNTGTTSLALTEQAPVCTSAILTTAFTNATCAGTATGSATVTPTGGTAPYTYLWSNGATTQTISNLLAGTYTATVTEGGGCKATSSPIVVGANTLAATITPSGATTFCPGGSVNLTASGGTSYKWSTGATTAAVANITATGTYTVTVTNGTCTATATQAVTVSNTATATITASGATNFCQGSSVNLTAAGTGTYKWSTGATTATLSNITTAGTYAVTVTNGTCTATASQIVTVSTPPTATITASGATTFCQGKSVTLTASGGTVYKWSNGATTAATDVTTAGTYTVSVTNSACTASTSKVVSTIPAPSVQVTSTKSNGLNGTATATVTGGTPPYKYDWNNNATNYTLIGLSAGTYFVTVTDANGCTGEGSVVVGSITPTTDLTNGLPLTISPMPNNGHFLLTMELPIEQVVHVEVFNMQGQQVAKQLIFGKSIATLMNMSNLTTGQYLMKVDTQSGRTTKKMMIVK
jgi:hypothetical protein